MEEKANYYFIIKVMTTIKVNDQVYGYNIDLVLYKVYGL